MRPNSILIEMDNLITYDEWKQYMRDVLNSTLVDTSGLLANCSHTQQEWLESRGITADSFIKITYAKYPLIKSTVQAVGCMALLGAVDPMLCFIEFSKPIKTHCCDLINILELEIIGSVSKLLEE